MWLQCRDGGGGGGVGGLMTGGREVKKASDHVCLVDHQHFKGIREPLESSQLNGGMMGRVCVRMCKYVLSHFLKKRSLLCGEGIIAAIAVIESK